MGCESNINFSASENRVLFIAKLLLETDEWIKSIDVQDTLAISPAQLICNDFCQEVK